MSRLAARCCVIFLARMQYSNPSLIFPDGLDPLPIPFKLKLEWDGKREIPQALTELIHLRTGVPPTFQTVSTANVSPVCYVDYHANSLGHWVEEYQVFEHQEALNPEDHEVLFPKDFVQITEYFDPKLKFINIPPRKSITLFFLLSKAKIGDTSSLRNSPPNSLVNFFGGTLEECRKKAKKALICFLAIHKFRPGNEVNNLPQEIAQIIAKKIWDSRNSQDWFPHVQKYDEKSHSIQLTIFGVDPRKCYFVSPGESLQNYLRNKGNTVGLLAGRV